MVSHHDNQRIVMWNEFGVLKVISWKLNLNSVLVSENLPLEIGVSDFGFVATIVESRHAVAVLSRKFAEFSGAAEETGVILL